MDIFQTITTTLGLVYGAGRPYYSHPDDAESLRLRLKWDLTVVDKILVSLGSLQRERSTLSDEEKQLWDAGVEHMAKLSGELTKIQETMGNVTTRLFWWHHVGDYRELERELFQWTQRFDVRLLNLPQAMRTVIDFQNLDLDTSNIVTPYSASQSRIEQFRKLGEAVRMESLESLNISNPNYQFPVSSIPARHVFAKFNGKDVIVEYKKPPQAILNQAQQLQAFQQSIAEVCAILNRCEPSSTGVLKSLGYFWDARNKQYGMIYEIPLSISPSDKTPLTLSSMLREPQDSLSAAPKAATPKHALNERFRLAKELATAVFFLHACGWVHKDIRPGNIIIPQSSRTPEDKRFPFKLGRPYLVSLESARGSRNHSDPSTRAKLAVWDRDIYLHPDRVFNGSQIDQYYTMSHDVYSLGIVLLEIGLWRLMSTLKPLKDLFATIPLPSDGLTSEEIILKKRELILHGLACQSAINMGSKYAKVVEDCLTVDGTTGNVNFITDVLEKLEKLSESMN
jgi:hypothetical protein